MTKPIPLQQENGQESTLPKDLRWALPPYTRGQGIAIFQTPIKQIYPHVITVNEEPYTDSDDVKYAPDFLVKDICSLDMFASRSLDFVCCNIFYKENGIETPLKEYWRIIKAGGHLCVFVKEESEEMKNAIQSLKDAQLENALVSQTEVLLVLKKQKEPLKRLEPGQKTACVVRYGAFGDLMRASSVCAGLKKQGYHVTLQCSPPGSDILTHDPNIDAFVLTDKDQVRNSDLAKYWDYQKTLYDKWVNLCESEEGTLLELTGLMKRPGPQWHPALREKHKNFNYMEFQHEIAQVPHCPEIRFYPSPEEKYWASQERAKTKTKFVILWQFEGSSVNKVWTGEVENGFDKTIARIMTAYKDVSVVVTGGALPPFSFSQWDNEPRFQNKRGVWTMRQTLSFLDQVDLVIGPETGTLNAACMMDMPKIIMLSHSTVENLTRDWKNTISLSTKHLVCQGRGNNEAKACHQIHYGWDSCTQDKVTGTAACMAGITVDDVWNAVVKSLPKATFTDFYKENILGSK
jgi:ADP-heptose:LPS heptosyltransferase